jgi:myo-inositol-1(or 4)-monophosphatase
MPDPAALLELAVPVAAEAAALLVARHPGVRDDITTKTTPTDLVTAVDRAAETLIVERLLAARPDDGILAEEGMGTQGTSGVRWIIDPLDGTVNYVYGFPAFAVSIGAEIDGEIVTGVVHDAARDEVFTATLGEGARRDGAPISVSGHDVLATALIGTGFPYAADGRAATARTLVGVLPHIRDIRRAGAAALDLCSVACGRLDGYYELGLAPWDLAAGGLIVREAGGVTSDFAGGPMRAGSVVATTPLLHQALLDLLDRASRDSERPNAVDRDLPE